MPPRPTPDNTPDPENITITDVWAELQRVKWLLDGNADYGIKGIRAELKETSDSLAAIVALKDRIIWALRIMGVVVSVTGIGTLIQILPPLINALSSSK